MSPRTQEANEALHEKRRMTILNAALGAFVERGFEGTRIQEIADRCALSYGLVYRYFPTKEAIFTTLVDMALAAAGSLIQTLPQGAPPRAFGAFISFAVSDPAPLYFALIVEALTKQSVPPELAARAREKLMGFKAVIAAAGNLADPGDAVTRAEGILAILIGTSIMKICGLSDGIFASRVVTVLTAPGKE
jgi:AcrR family transcriptional regulator